MKGEAVAMDRAGRVVLPKPVREELNLVPGDKLRLSVEGNSIRLEAISEKGEFVRKGSVLVLTSKLAAPVTTKSVEQLLLERDVMKI
jgi:AbrB family looped-hinge helix DNA binding protein